MNNSEDKLFTLEDLKTAFVAGKESLIFFPNTGETIEDYDWDTWWRDYVTQLSVSEQQFLVIKNNQL